MRQNILGYLPRVVGLWEGRASCRVESQKALWIQTLKKYSQWMEEGGGGPFK